MSARATRIEEDYDFLLANARAGTQPEWYQAGPNPFGDGHASERIVARMLGDLRAPVGA